jgi:hypothetical protein
MRGLTAYEYAYLFVEALTPIAVLALGIAIARSARRLEHLQHANQTVIGRRLEVFTAVAVNLNRLLCFATFVGRWKEITPDNALSLKRQVDEVMYANRLLFSDELVVVYIEFMHCLFAMYAKVDGDAPIRAAVASPLGDRTGLHWWRPQLVAKFDTQTPVSPADAQRAYDKLAAAFRSDLYVTDLGRPLLRPVT